MVSCRSACASGVRWGAIAAAWPHHAADGRRHRAKRTCRRPAPADQRDGGLEGDRAGEGAKRIANALGKTAEARSPRASLLLQVAVPTASQDPVHKPHGRSPFRGIETCYGAVGSMVYSHVRSGAAVQADQDNGTVNARRCSLVGAVCSPARTSSRPRSRREAQRRGPTQRIARLLRQMLNTPDGMPPAIPARGNR